MGGIFSAPKPAPIAPPPKETDAEIQERKRLAREQERKRKGLASTILSGAEGEQEENLNIGTKTLLGQ